MTRSARAMRALMTVIGLVTYLTIWAFEMALRHRLLRMNGLRLDASLTVGEGFGALGVVTALLIAVHLVLWTEMRATDLDEEQERRANWLDLYVIGCGAGAVAIGVAAVASAVGRGELSGGAIGVGFVAAMTMALAADASAAVRREVIQRGADREARERIDALQAIVDRLGDDGPSPTVAVRRLAGWVVVVAIVSPIVGQGPSGPSWPGLVAPAVAAVLLLLAVGCGAYAWLSRRWLLELLPLVAIVPALVMLALVAAMVRSRDRGDLVAALAVGFVAPLVGGVVSVVRRTGAVRALVAAVFRATLRRADDVLDRQAAAT